LIQRLFESFRIYDLLIVTVEVVGKLSEILLFLCPSRIGRGGVRTAAAVLIVDLL
jgi:hypothetical protein